MYLEQKNYRKETIKEVQNEQINTENPILNGGYPTFNECDHTTLDITSVMKGEGMQTLSIKVDDEKYVTMCFIKTGEKEIDIDIKFHGEGNTKVLSFKDGTDEKILNAGLLALINKY